MQNTNRLRPEFVCNLLTRTSAGPPSKREGARVDSRTFMSGDLDQLGIPGSHWS